ncbi:hypothetical protein E2C01_065057 [Portunus trituberculatus]|uniref:Uncharacterized protein n=1 Tax=Portunus trituberculatus TaxID=210409 RepID=A0A5B7HQ25_PORTR|nr:hypothetical protein [Portunus trituberculatus]
MPSCPEPSTHTPPRHAMLRPHQSPPSHEEATRRSPLVFALLCSLAEERMSSGDVTVAAFQPERHSEHDRHESTAP